MATPMHGKSADLAMLYADWLHASAASSFADVYRDQPSSHAYDRFHSIPLSSNINDGRLYHKLENADAPKKFFVDRQIKKAKSLSGLIKGTALSRHSSSNSSSFLATTPTNPSQHDASLISLNDSSDNVLSTSRRPRVCFADSNRVQFFEHSNDEQRRHPYRPSRKLAADHEPIQPTQTSSRPLSRQKHLPDALNQSLPLDIATKEKYVLQREKPLLRFPLPAMDQPIHSPAEVSRESARIGETRPSLFTHYSDPHADDVGLGSLLTRCSISSNSTSRSRPSLQAISLRQQFVSPTKTKTSTAALLNPSLTRRSMSLKQSSLQAQPAADQHNHEPVIIQDDRPIIRVDSSKQSKRNYILHFDSKGPSNGNASHQSNGTARYPNFDFYDSSTNGQDFPSSSNRIIV